jgi:hypothetical protein
VSGGEETMERKKKEGHELAATFTEVTGKPAKFVDLPIDAYVSFSKRRRVKEKRGKENGGR